MAVLGPAIAGFWQAGVFREMRVDLIWLGTLLTTLLYAINWLMLADVNCCSFNQMNRGF